MNAVTLSAALFALLALLAARDRPQTEVKDKP
jgi:hypothetical protein